MRRLFGIRSGIRSCVVVGLSLLPGALSAQNLLVNTDFIPSFGMSSWTYVDGMSTAVCGTSGTCGAFSVVAVACCGKFPDMGVQTAAPAGAAVVALTQCVGGVTPGGYDFGAFMIRTVAPGMDQGNPSARVEWFSSADCTGSPIGAASVASMSGAWERVALAANAPPGTASASFRLEVGNGGAGPFSTATLAAPFLGPTGTVPVTLETFTVE